MPPTTTAARSVVLAALGFIAASTAFAQIPPASNVAAFNPYTGGGWANAGPPRAYPANQPIILPPAVITDTPTATVGAFNPWRSQVRPPAAISPYGTYVDTDATTNLPSPPPGPIRSRLLAVPQRGDSSTSRAPRSAPVSRAAEERPQPVIVAAAAPPPVVMATPAARPIVVAPVTVAPVTVAPAPAPPPARVVAAPAPPPPDPAPPVGGPAPTVRVLFAGQSAELTDAARSDLDRLAQSINSKGTRQIELRAYAGGNGPESRKVSLARALAVRSYLIDRGVKSRIDVGAFLAESIGGANERVDVVAPNT